MSADNSSRGTSQAGQRRMRAVFFGTPAIAVPALHALTEVADVVAVVCQPDRPSGRGMKLVSPALKQAAEHLGLPVHQPIQVKTGNLHVWLAELDVDAALVLAYGRILPPSVLSAPRRGCFNLHASLLPKYRGAAPINWALIHGERETGISLMQMDEGLDTGPVYVRRTIPIDATDNAGTLTDKLAELAADVTRTDFPRAIAGGLVAMPQDDAIATPAPPLTRAHGLLDFNQPARELVNRVRGLTPKPGAYTAVRGKGFRVWEARVSDDDVPAPGQVRIGDKRRLIVGTASGGFEILEGQLEGRKRLSAAELVNGRALHDGEHLGK